MEIKKTTLLWSYLICRDIFVGDYFLTLCNLTSLVSEKNVLEINETINKSAKIKNNTLTTSIPKNVNPAKPNNPVTKVIIRKCKV